MCTCRTEKPLEFEQHSSNNVIISDSVTTVHKFKQTSEKCIDDCVLLLWLIVVPTVFRVLLWIRKDDVTLPSPSNRRVDPESRSSLFLTQVNIYLIYTALVCAVWCWWEMSCEHV